MTARFRSDAESHPTPSITLHVVQPSSPDPMASNGLVPPPAYRTPSTGVAKPQGRRTSHAGSVAGSVARSQSARQAANDGVVATTTLCIPNAEKNRSRSVGARSVRSMRSTTSRRSKWGDDNAEPLGDVKRRQFEEFHANNGVRTVVGKVGNVDNVRMLLKAGYRNIYLSRAFAVRHGLLSKKVSFRIPITLTAARPRHGRIHRAQDSRERADHGREPDGGAQCHAERGAAL